MTAIADKAYFSLRRIFETKMQILFVCLLLASSITFAQEISYIDIHQAKKLHEQGVLFVDARSWIERKLGKIEGAVAMKKTEVADVAQYLITDKDQAVVMYCAVGARASVAAANLKGNGLHKCIRRGKWARLFALEKSGLSYFTISFIDYNK